MGEKQKLVRAVLSCMIIAVVLAVGIPKLVGMLQAESERVTVDGVGFEYVGTGAGAADEFLDFGDLNQPMLGYQHYFHQEKDGLQQKEHQITQMLIDRADNPDEKLTLHYTVWESDNPEVLDRQELKLQKAGAPEAITSDYGAQAAYRLNDRLVLRYNGYLFCFEPDTTQSVLESEACAAYMREFAEYEKTGPF